MRKPTKKTRIGRQIIYYHNHNELSELKREIFNEQIYHFKSDNPQPRIIDVGAYIGLTTLYFKSVFPEAIITCFEPVPANFELLEQNIFENGLFDVECINCAITQQTGKTTMYIDPATKDQWYSSASLRLHAWNGQQATTPIQVSTQTLSPWLDQPIDLVKMDIEGAEWRVLPTIAAQFHLIHQFIIECHPSRTAHISTLTNLLQRGGYRIDLIPRRYGLKLLSAIRDERG